MAFYDEFEKYAERTALITEAEELSYQALQNEIDEVKAQMETRALTFCVCTNSIESVVGYLACLQKKTVVVMINDHIDRELFQNLQGLYQPDYIWAPQGFMKEAPDYTYRDYMLVKMDSNRQVSIHEELAVLLTTSGSTGSPKLVKQSYKNINSNAASIAEYLKITKEDRPITTLPMSYTYGLSIINSHLLMGASIILTDQAIVQPVFWKLLQGKEATTFGGVPYTYEMLKKLRFLKRDYPSLKVLTQAGGKLGKEMHYEFATGLKEKGIRFVVMYGQTEATARMSYVPEENSVAKAGSIGIAIPGGKFWLEDENGNRIQNPQETGELIYQGDNVTMGYAEGAKDLAKGYERGDILHTGDMAMFDEDGYYYVVGRKKRFLKLFGNRVNLDEVEGLLKKQGIECVASGVDDKMKVYITNPEQEQLAKEYLLEHTAIPRQAVSIKIIDEIPRNEAGKILYSALE